MGLLIVFIILAAIFGVGGVIKGILWAVLIGAVLLIAAIAGVQALSGGGRGTRTT
jgi:hypothetical protein